MIVLHLAVAVALLSIVFLLLAQVEGIRRFVCGQCGHRMRPESRAGYRRPTEQERLAAPAEELPWVAFRVVETRTACSCGLHAQAWRETHSRALHKVVLTEVEMDELAIEGRVYQ